MKPETFGGFPRGRLEKTVPKWIQWSKWHVATKSWSQLPETVPNTFTPENTECRILGEGLGTGFSMMKKGSYSVTMIQTLNGTPP